MGIRGIGAKPIKRPKHDALDASGARQRRHSWEALDLSRAERVIRFVESLPCSAGPLAGTQFKLRPWQNNSSAPSIRLIKPAIDLCEPPCCRLDRGNGKTTLAASLGACPISPDLRRKSRGEVYSAANDRWQASPYLFRSVRHGGTCAVVV